MTIVIHKVTPVMTFLAVTLLSLTLVAQSDQGRSSDGLIALYDFQATAGNVIHDTSDAGKPLDLKVSDTTKVKRSIGSLRVTGDTLIQSANPADKVISAVRQSGELSVEAWVRSADLRQEGPSRIVSISKNTSERNFTLGQENDRFDVRLRTTKTTTNGLPSLPSSAKTVTTDLTHLAYVYSKTGEATLYINGVKSAQRKIAGGFGNWDRGYRLSLANEATGDRSWVGEFQLVAVYARSLSAGDVARHFQAGPKGKLSPQELALKRTKENRHLFTTRVAAILSKHCFECHDSTTKQGELDLSRREAAMLGGESGKVIVAGNAKASSLFASIEEDEMPKDRDPLSAEEKAILKKWIDAGAEWPLETIDPAVYAHDGGSGDIWVQRLTVTEYIETVRATFGVDISKEAREMLPADLRADGFSNTAYNLGVDLKHVEAYAQLAEVIVSRLEVVDFAGKFSRNRRLIDNDMRGLIEKMGRKVYRGPLSDDEVAILRGISTTVASTGGDYKEAVSYILQAMLQSPRFIYRIESQQRSGRVSDYELASRMSYIVWGGPPDDELLNLAEQRKLTDKSIFAAQAKRMLNDRRAIARSSQFIAEWLNLNRLANLNPDRERFPNWNDQLASDMRKETLAYFEDVCWKQNRPLSDLLNAQFTYATPALAKHYGLKPTDDSLAKVDLSQTPHRGGLLTQGAALTVGGDEASMVSRGLFVLHDLLRGTVKDPPPCVDTTPIPSKPGLSQRGVAEARVANQACGGCHVKFEPLAYGLEKYDGLGAFHETDKFGNALREDGAVLFPGDAKPTPFKNAAELMNLLADSDRVKKTLSWKATQFSLGRPLSAIDAPLVDAVHKQSQADGGHWRSLMLALLHSDLVQLSSPRQQ